MKWKIDKHTTLHNPSICNLNCEFDVDFMVHKVEFIVCLERFQNMSIKFQPTFSSNFTLVSRNICDLLGPKRILKSCIVPDLRVDWMVGKQMSKSHVFWWHFKIVNRFISSPVLSVCLTDSALDVCFMMGCWVPGSYCWTWDCWWP